MHTKTFSQCNSSKFIHLLPRLSRDRLLLPRARGGTEEREGVKGRGVEEGRRAEVEEEKEEVGGTLERRNVIEEENKRWRKTMTRKKKRGEKSSNEGKEPVHYRGKDMRREERVGRSLIKKKGGDERSDGRREDRRQKNMKVNWRGEER